MNRTGVNFYRHHKLMLPSYTPLHPSHLPPSPRPQALSLWSVTASVSSSAGSAQTGNPASKVSQRRSGHRAFPLKTADCVRILRCLFPLAAPVRGRLLQTHCGSSSRVSLSQPVINSTLSSNNHLHQSCWLKEYWRGYIKCSARKLSLHHTRHSPQQSPSKERFLTIPVIRKYQVKSLHLLFGTWIFSFLPLTLLSPPHSAAQPNRWSLPDRCRTKKNMLPLGHPLDINS